MFTIAFSHGECYKRGRNSGHTHSSLNKTQLKILLKYIIWWDT